MRKVSLSSESSWEINHLGPKARSVSEFVPIFVNLNSKRNGGVNSVDSILC